MDVISPGDAGGVGKRPRFRSSSPALPLVALGLVPAVVLGSFLAAAADRGLLAYDARTGYLPLARRLLDGESPYPAGNYPPLGFSLFVPFTEIPRPEVLLTILMVAAVPAVLFALGIRDWRCYGAVFLWAPVISAIQTSNLTLPLALACALAWRWRDRPLPAGAALGLSIAAKLITAPLVVWLAATRRLRAAVAAVALAVGVTVGLLALIAGSTELASNVKGLPGNDATPSYGAIDIASGLGLPREVGMAAVAVLTLALCAASFRFARGGDDRRSFAAAALAITMFAPNVWLHSLTFLVLAIGVMRPRFDALWLAPVVLLVVPVNDPSTWEWLLLWVTFACMSVWVLARPAQDSA